MTWAKLEYLQISVLYPATMKPTKRLGWERKKQGRLIPHRIYMSSEIARVITLLLYLWFILISILLSSHLHLAIKMLLNEILLDIHDHLSNYRLNSLKTIGMWNMSSYYIIIHTTCSRYLKIMFLDLRKVENIIAYWWIRPNIEWDCIYCFLFPFISTGPVVWHDMSWPFASPSLNISGCFSASDINSPSDGGGRHPMGRSKYENSPTANSTLKSQWRPAATKSRQNINKERPEGRNTRISSKLLGEISRNNRNTIGQEKWGRVASLENK